MRFALPALALVAVVSLTACGSDDDAAATPAADTGTSAKDTGTVADTGSTVDTGGTTDTGTVATDSASSETSAETGPAPVNGCTTFVDATTDAAKRTIAWSLSTTTTCLKITKGQSVTWNGSLSSHPLAAFNGDTPSPITATSTGTTATIVFANAGTFGFHCTLHASMNGAIQVVP